MISYVTKVDAMEISVTLKVVINAVKPCIATQQPVLLPRSEPFICFAEQSLVEHQLDLGAPFHSEFSVKCASVSTFVCDFKYATLEVTPCMMYANNYITNEEEEDAEYNCNKERAHPHHLNALGA